MQCHRHQLARRTQSIALVLGLLDGCASKDDKPDIGLVTRASHMPERTSCTPVACIAGKVMAACANDADCDSAPGIGDGDCDACAIKGGPTTENEMFALMPWYVMPPKP